MRDKATASSCITSVTQHFVKSVRSSIGNWSFNNFCFKLVRTNFTHTSKTFFKQTKSLRSSMLCIHTITHSHYHEKLLTPTTAHLPLRTEEHGRPSIDYRGGTMQDIHEETGVYRRWWRQQWLWHINPNLLSGVVVWNSLQSNETSDNLWWFIPMFQSIRVNFSPCLLRCLALEEQCCLEDLMAANEKAVRCAQSWPNILIAENGLERRRPCRECARPSLSGLL